MFRVLSGPLLPMLFCFFAGNCEAMRTQTPAPAQGLFIDARGNVGIGTETPEAKLDIVGEYGMNSRGTVNVGEKGFNIPGLVSLNANPPDRVGQLTLRGANGTNNVDMVFSLPDHGSIHLYGDGYIPKITMEIDQRGRGVIHANSIKFVEEHPEQADRWIAYHALQGPQGSVYLRGEGRLKSGRTRVNFPEHFRATIAANSISVQLTPADADTFGVGLASVDASGMEVRERGGGTGDARFYYTITARRKGAAPIPTIQNRAQLPGAARSSGVEQ